MFRPAAGRFDGVTGSGIAIRARSLPLARSSASRSCPLSFFLRDILHLRELEDEPERTGSRSTSSETPRTTLGEESITGLWKDGLPVPGAAPGRRRSSASNPSGARAREGRRSLARQAPRPLSRSSAGSGSSRSGASSRRILTARGRARSHRPPAGGELRSDRPGKGAASSYAAPSSTGSSAIRGRRRHDYKTGRDEGKVEERAILRGLHLQLPLYREVAAAAHGVLPLLVEAGSSPWAPIPGRKGRRARWKATRSSATASSRRSPSRSRSGEEETSLSRSPMEIRRTAPGAPTGEPAGRAIEPTVERLESDTRLADFRNARKKDKGTVTIAGGEGEQWRPALERRRQ